MLELGMLAMQRMISILWALIGLHQPPITNKFDGNAMTATGGIELRQAGDIDMVSEDLYISGPEVRVRYIFRNRSARPLETLVAIPFSNDDLADIDYTRATDFTAKINGRGIPISFETRAFLNGRDVTAKLARHRIPLRDEYERSAPSIEYALSRLSPAVLQQLKTTGLIQEFTRDEDGRPVRTYAPMWTIRDTAYWDQIFPAQQDVIIEYRYYPGADRMAGTMIEHPALRNQESVQQMIEQYCIDDVFLRSVDGMIANADKYTTVSETSLSYIFKIGPNWHAPIGDFHMVIDKGRPQNLISFCDKDAKRISPTQFEVHRKNWRPTGDFDVLIKRVPNLPVE